MGYSDVDQKCINTIRTLAVRLILLSLFPARSVPHHDVFKDNDEALHQQCFQCPQWTISLREHRLITCSTGRCDLQGQLWSPGCAYGYGPNRPCPLQQVHEIQPKEPTLGQPRPLRSLVRLPTRMSPLRRWKRASSWHWSIFRNKTRSTGLPYIENMGFARHCTRIYITRR